MIELLVSQPSFLPKATLSNSGKQISWYSFGMINILQHYIDIFPCFSVVSIVKLLCCTKSGATAGYHALNYQNATLFCSHGIGISIESLFLNPAIFWDTLVK